MGRIKELSDAIRRCDPGHYLAKEQIVEVISIIQALEEEEANDSNGHMGWFYMKVKANAHHHGLTFEIPERWAHLYEHYKKDLKIYEMPEPLKKSAIILRNLGLRKSFIQGEGRTEKYKV